MRFISIFTTSFWNVNGKYDTGKKPDGARLTLLKCLQDTKPKV